jgi:hypothetical protein
MGMRNFDCCVAINRAPQNTAVSYLFSFQTFAIAVAYIAVQNGGGDAGANLRNVYRRHRVLIPFSGCSAFCDKGAFHASAFRDFRRGRCRSHAGGDLDAADGQEDPLLGLSSVTASLASLLSIA